MYFIFKRLTVVVILAGTLLFVAIDKPVEANSQEIIDVVDVFAWGDVSGIPNNASTVKWFNRSETATLHSVFQPPEDVVPGPCLGLTPWWNHVNRSKPGAFTQFTNVLDKMRDFGCQVSISSNAGTGTQADPYQLTDIHPTGD